MDSPDSPRRRRRLIVLAIAGLLLIGAVLFYQRYFFVRPIGSGPAGPSVAAEPFATVWSERHVKFVGIGDSITAGFGANSPSHSFFNRVAHNPSDEFADMCGKCLSAVLPNLEVQNLSVSGSTSKGHLEAIENKLQKQDQEVYGIVVITTGGNDLIHNYGQTPPRECAMYGASLAQAEPWIAAFEVRLNKMLDLIDERFPGGCEIHLADIYDPTDGVGDAPSVFLPPWPDGLAIHARYNEVIVATAKARLNVHLVPLHQTFLGHGSHCRQFWRATYVADDPYYWFFQNIEDPNDRGYDAIRRVFLNSIIEHSPLVPRTDRGSDDGE